MSDQPNMDRVEGLMLATALGLAPDEFHDSLLDATPAEKLLVARFAQEVTQGWQSTGVLPSSPAPLDATFKDAAHMAAQAAEFLAAFTVMRRWGWELRFYAGRRLGDMLQVIPADQAERVLTHLRRAFPHADLGFDLIVPEEAEDE